MPAHLPQPAWFGPLSVEAQEHDPASTLALYRQALSWRRKLQAAESLEWMPGTNGQVLHFGRPGGWRSVTNFGPRPVPLPHGTVVVASSLCRTACCPPTPPPGSSRQVIVSPASRPRRRPRPALACLLGPGRQWRQR